MPWWSCSTGAGICCKLVSGMNYELMVAVYESDVDAVRLALECGANPNHCVDGNTPLLQAVVQDRLDLVQVLLEFGADPNLGSPVHHTFYLEVVEALLDAGASIAPNRDGSIMHAAVSELDLLKYLIGRAQGQPYLEWYDRDFGDTLLGSAARSGYAESVRFLLELGSDPNRCNPDMIARTPLATAATTNPETVQLLLEAGADPDHSWGLCATGREALEKAGPVMRALLTEADRHPERYKRFSHS